MTCAISDSSDKNTRKIATPSLTLRNCYNYIIHANIFQEALTHFSQLSISFHIHFYSFCSNAYFAQPFALPKLLHFSCFVYVFRRFHENVLFQSMFFLLLFLSFQKAIESGKSPPLDCRVACQMHVHTSMPCA